MYFVRPSSIPSLQSQASTPKRALLRHGNLLSTLILIPRTTRRWPRLVGPRRPGSAMSSYSNLHSRSTGNVTTRSATHMPPKPLIDINELTGPKRSQTSPQEKNTAGLTGAIHCSRRRPRHTHRRLWWRARCPSHHSPPCSRMLRANTPSL